MCPPTVKSGLRIQIMIAGHYCVLNVHVPCPPIEGTIQSTHGCPSAPLFYYLNFQITMVPLGLEPRTYWLKAKCSTIELTTTPVPEGLQRRCTRHFICQMEMAGVEPASELNYPNHFQRCRTVRSTKVSNLTAL